MSDPIRLRYTGEQAVTFQYPGVGHQPPGGEFDIPLSALLSFMRRADIEHVGECHQPPCQCGEEPEPEVSEDAAEGGGRRPAKRTRAAAAGTGEGSDEAHG